MLLPASVDDNVVRCHSAEHPSGASALRELVGLFGWGLKGLLIGAIWGAEAPPKK